jgi:hypothetical protein
MGKHDDHLPRKDVNKAADTRGASPALVRQITYAQGQGTKEDAKAAKQGGGKK